MISFDCVFVEFYGIMQFALWINVVNGDASDIFEAFLHFTLGLNVKVTSDAT